MVIECEEVERSAADSRVGGVPASDKAIAVTVFTLQRRSFYADNQSFVAGRGRLGTMRVASLSQNIAQIDRGAHEVISGRI